MNAFQQLVYLLIAVEYKRGWKLRVRMDKERNHAPYLQWEFIANDAKTGEVAIQQSRKWYLSYHMTESELIQTAFKAALTAEEHECRESFTYRGKRVFNPHISVQSLLRVCEQEDART